MSGLISCGSAAMLKMLIFGGARICECCGKEFYPSTPANTKYCSPSCGNTMHQRSYSRRHMEAKKADIAS